MIPASSSFVVSMKLENSEMSPSVVWYHTDVVAWLPVEGMGMTPMVWDQDNLVAVTLSAWVDGRTKAHSDKTDSWWGVTYVGLNRWEPGMTT